MTLHLVQMRPEMGALMRWATRVGSVSPQGQDDFGYALHAALTAAFGRPPQKPNDPPGYAPAPFALMDQRGRPAELLAYTSRVVEMRTYAGTYATPEVFEALGLEHLAVKPMPERFASGTRLGFRLRARPTVRRDRDGDRTRTREHDAYLAAIEPYRVGAAPMTRGEVYLGWLARQLAGAADVEQATLASFRLTRTLRRDRARHLHPIPASSPTMGGAAGHPDATFAGTLSVGDPEKFAALLARGVGRHRAFGFGMLLLRPPG